MPVLLQDPCDNFTAAPWVNVGGSVTASGKTGNGFSIPASATTVTYTIPGGSESASVTVGFWLKFTAISGVAAPFIVFRGDAGATSHCSVQAYDNGGGNCKIAFYRTNPSQVLGTFSPGTPIQTNVWAYVEASMLLSDTVGTVEIRVNGAQVVSAINQDTKSAGTATVLDTIRLASGSGLSLIVDDIYIRNDGTFGAGGTGVSNSLTDYERILLNSAGTLKSSMNDLIKSNFAGTDAQKARMSMNDMVLVAQGIQTYKTTTDVTYALGGTGITNFMSLADKSMKEFTAGGVAKTGSNADYAYRKVV